MTEILVIIGWVLITLAVASFSGIIGKRWGVQYIIAISAALIVIVNVMNTKLVAVGPYVVPGGALLFGATFLLTDIISEKFGKKYAKQAVWAGFFSLIIFVIMLWIVLNWDAAPFAVDTAKSFSEVLGLAPRIVLGSMVAYLVGQHHDVWAFHFWKKITRGKHLWLRNNASTAVSQFIDSFIFVVIAFYGIVPNIMTLIISVYIFKLLIAVADTPFIYGVSYLMDRIKSN